MTDIAKLQKTVQRQNEEMDAVQRQHEEIYVMLARTQEMLKNAMHGRLDTVLEPDAAPKRREHHDLDLVTGVDCLLMVDGTPYRVVGHEDGGLVVICRPCCGSGAPDRRLSYREGREARGAWLDAAAENGPSLTEAFALDLARGDAVLLDGRIRFVIYGGDDGEGNVATCGGEGGTTWVWTPHPRLHLHRIDHLWRMSGEGEDARAYRTRFGHLWRERRRYAGSGAKRFTTPPGSGSTEKESEPTSLTIESPGTWTTPSKLESRLDDLESRLDGLDTTLRILMGADGRHDGGQRQ